MPSIRFTDPLTIPATAVHLINVIDYFYPANVRIVQTSGWVNSFYIVAMSSLPLDVISLPPADGQAPTGLLVLLHGWGANYHDLAGLAPMLRRPTDLMLFPNAPFPHPYSASGRMWYGLPSDFTFSMSTEFAQSPELTQSRSMLVDWLFSLESLTGVPLSETVLGGFSQGGAMTLDVGMRVPLKKLMVLSGYLHAPIEIQIDAIPPILLVHGTQDPVVPIAAARQAKDALKAVHAPITVHELYMGHEIQPAVLNFMQSFLSEEGLNDRESVEKA